MKYEQLLEYYNSCLNFVDCFHYNSKVSHDVYQNHLGERKGQIVPITHDGIQDCRVLKTYVGKVLNIGFIGNSTPYKGLPLLVSTLKEIGQSTLWKLFVYGGKTGQEKDCPIYYRGVFKKDGASKVYSEMDVLIVPSIWKETFSLVTLEALSYGVPVVVSLNVGAQELVKHYNPMFVYSSQGELKDLLCTIIKDRKPLIDFNRKILEGEWTFSVERHAQDIIEKVYLKNNSDF